MRMELFYLYTLGLVILLLHVEDGISVIHRDSKGIKVGNMLHLHGYRLIVTPQATLELRNEMICVTSCVKTDGCYSVNVKKKADGGVSCELLKSTKFQHPENLTRDESSVHWYAKDMSPCVPNPCEPSGTCARKDSVLEPFTCVCDSNGVSGKYCEIYDKDHNFALLKPTAQSSICKSALVADPYESKYAVDGIKVGSCSANGVASCACTNNDANKWWRVDLEVVIPVARVAITNRKDWGSGLQDFEIKIGNSLMNEGQDNPKCGDRHMVPFKEAKEIPCSPPLTGRYVVIQSFQSGGLIIIEVEVFAEL